MINARMEILITEVLNKCKAMGIGVYPLKNSMANCIAFTSDYRRRREFELTFLKESKYRISTRFLGYRKAMVESGANVYECNDPDGRRKRFYVNLPDEDAVNRMIRIMLDNGFSETPDVQRC